MNQNFSGAVLLLIIAAAGLYTNHPAAWWLAGVTAALAFISEELRHFDDGSHPRNLVWAGTIIALLSWITTAAAAYSLL